ncbi:MAG: glycoside hydrolase family 13 protein [Clostridia bacterium]|nr:glycoside hydrolase family 13 protein [Clostridia bacterium]
MLPKNRFALEQGASIRLKKYANGQAADLFGAFPYGTRLTFCACVPRRMGVGAVVLRLFPDGDDARDLPFSFIGTAGGTDEYRLEMESEQICTSERGGLFFYELLFLRGGDTLFSDTADNVSLSLSHASGRRFRLLIHEADFHTPRWFRGGTMYHVFVDRFCRGEGKAELRSDATLNEDWENGVPQYAQKPGEALANDVFFGGNLWGVTEKLDHLQELGVTVLYLSPIFEAYSNHRYDTGDYEKVDALLGGEEAFACLVREAHARGMKILLDGVFNHTGDDSRYFNRRGRYSELGAYQSAGSPYADWYSFRARPEEYDAWWGIKILPRLNQYNPVCRRYFTGENGIAQKWIRAGADGWRLDVADELPDVFLDELREAVKREDPEALLLGEVWENAADKMAYGVRRRYFGGRQLDSVMNYPFRNAILSLLTQGDAVTFCNILTEIYASYPKEVSDSLMNLLGTHDTERILTVLGAGVSAGATLDNATLARKRLTDLQREKAVTLLKIASLLQFTVYGVPSVYYGDEAGLEGYRDPFCRMPYPWGRENRELQEHYKKLGALRREHGVFREGSFRFLQKEAHAFTFEREGEGERILVAVNVGNEPFHVLPMSKGRYRDAFTGAPVKEEWLAPCEATVLVEEKKE